MTDSKMTDLVIKITSELASLNANMKTVLDKLTGHEQRISALEQGKFSLKDNIVKWLVIALIGYHQDDAWNSLIVKNYSLIIY